MIYEYPEDFVVPIVYSKDLKPMHREWEFKYVRIDELLVPAEQPKGEKFSHMNEYKDLEDIHLGSFYDAEDINNKKMFYNRHLMDEDLDDESIEYILNDIDNEYANSETLRI